MSDTQKRYYHGDAVKYLSEVAGINTHGVWRDLHRHELPVYRDGKVNWTTQKALDDLIVIHDEKAAKSNRGKKLTDFAPGVSKEWIQMCEESDIRVKEKLAKLLEERRQQQ